MDKNLKMYREYKNLNLPVIESEILDEWKRLKIFEQSIQNRPDSKPYTFYEGPPSANGMPGIHHVMARSIKDIFCRYKTLKGYRVQRKGGWDTHGLPIELAVEKKLGITKEDIGKKISVEEYNAACKAEVMRYTDEWNRLTEKMGYWVDLENPYITYENNYIESLWWILKKFYEKGFLYKGYTVQPYSPAAGTGLSSHELNQPGCYRMVKDTSVVAQFRIDRTQKHPLLARLFGDVNEEVCLLAWTTTPWTLPSNSALAVGKNIRYVKVKTYNPYTHRAVSVILASDLIAKHFKAEAASIPLGDYEAGDKLIPWQVEGEFAGTDLAGLCYEQLLPYVQPQGASDKAFKVLLADFVTTEDGTGIVHLAPHFGSDDFRVCKEHNVPAIVVEVIENGLPIVSPLVDKQGKFVAEVSDFAGCYVKEEYYSDAERQSPDFKPTDVRIAIKLKEDNKAFKVEKYEHSYPHCWRTDKPVLYYPLDSWFIKTTAVKEQLIAANKTINWKPEATGTGRFGNWLENLVDWNLSRSRYWGTPLPIWRTNSWHIYPNLQPLDFCLGSISEIVNPDKATYYATGMTGGDDRTIKYGKAHQPLDIAKLNVKVRSRYFDEHKFQEFILNEQCQEDIKQKCRIWNDENITDRLNNIVHDAENGLVNPTHFRDLIKTIGYNEIRIYKPTNTHSQRKDFLENIIESTTSEVDASKLEDLHRPFIDNVVIIWQNQNQNTYNVYTREPDLIDVWFDSGAMPYAQWHYPFENKVEFEQAYPADFIAEGVDQTRGWFFTLHAIAVMLNECSDEVKVVNQERGNIGIAFKNVVSNGLVLDKNGNKMSKRLGNAVDPFETIAKYGADATRWYMISNASPWDNLKFNEEGLQEVQRKFFGTLYNTYAFFALYANIDKFSYEEPEIAPRQRPEIDRWIISLLHSLVEEVDGYYEEFEPTKAARAIQNFVDEHFSNWYVRLSRRRFWKGDYTEDKISAYQTLYTCLLTISKLMSPIAPFFSDRLFADLNAVSAKEQLTSVHLADFPTYRPELVDVALEQRMALAQHISSMILSLRKKVGINVRQPLSKVLLPVLDENFEMQVEAVKELILAETNIKHIEYIKDTSGILVKKIKPNFKALGAKVGKDMKTVAASIQAFSQQDIATIEQLGVVRVGTYSITVDDVEIIAEDVPGWQVANMGKLTVALDVTISESLQQEGIARELVNRVQNLRKDMGFDVTDKICVQLQNHSLITESVKNNFDYICGEVLANRFELVDNGVVSNYSIVLNEVELLISLAKS